MKLRSSGAVPGTLLGGSRIPDQWKPALAEVTLTGKQVWDIHNDPLAPLRRTPLRTTQQPGRRRSMRWTDLAMIGLALLACVLGAWGSRHEKVEVRQAGKVQEGDPRMVSPSQEVVE
jgi:hypothetical protein